MQNEADYGLALDGDGDRLMMVDRNGKVYDGDSLIYVIAKARALEGIEIGGVVGTVMTNMAMEIALKEQGVQFCRAKVGDRYVLEQLHQRGWLIGGEASGHILCMDKHNTGDGIIPRCKSWPRCAFWGRTWPPCAPTGSRIRKP